MKKSIRAAAALLACLSVLPAAVSCGGDTKPAETDSSDVQTRLVTDTAEVTADPNDRSQVKDTLPDTLDFSGRTFSVYCGNASLNDIFFKGPEEETAEIVDAAVFRRNRAVEERLGITLRSDPFPDEWNTIDKSISKLVMAGDATYDLFLGHTAGITKLVTENCFVNAYDLEYIDWEQPWWNNNFMNELALGEAYRFYLVGDYFMDTLQRIRTIFFNKPLYAQNFDTADSLYQEVLDGKWTFDRMIQLGADVYVDLNNNGVSDYDDQLGYCSYLQFSASDPFVYGTDIPFTKRDADGFIELNMMTEDAAELAVKLTGFFYQPGSFFQCDSDEHNIANFMSGRVLFTGYTSLMHAQRLRDMKDDFGFLPYPKFDEEQENYRCVVQDSALIGAISSASQNQDIAGAVLEALSAETYRSVIPAWYETALKIKYSRDDLSSQMIDLIHGAATTNFIYAYNYALNGIGLMYRDLITNKSTDYASMLSKKEKNAEKRLGKVIDAFHGVNS